MMSFPELVEAFLETYARKPSYDNYRRLCAQYFDHWESRPTAKQIRDWHRSLEHCPHHANKALSFLRSLFTWAQQEGYDTGDNPTAGIKQHGTQSRDRVLNEEELQRVRNGLDSLPAHAAALLALLMDVGCRPGEARTLRMSDLNLLTGRWIQYHTKNRRIHTTYISQQARARLRMLPLVGLYVFPGAEDGMCWSESGIDKMWKQVRARFNLPDVRLHDFRRTFATHLYRATKDRPLVKRCLNHTDGDVTDVYLRIQYEDIVAPMQAQADRGWGVTGPALPAPAAAPQSRNSVPQFLSQ